MILDATTKKLQLVLSAAHTTNALACAVDYVDMTLASTVSGIIPSNSNGTSPVDILAAPAAATQRKVNAISIFNADTVTHTVSINLDDNGTDYQLIRYTLGAGGTLGYTDTGGWYSINNDATIIGVTAGKAQQVDQTLTATTRAATTTLGTSLNHELSNTGADITAFNGVAGVTNHCRATGAGKIVNSAGLIVTQGLANITTAANDTWDVEMITSTTCRVKNYVSAITPKRRKITIGVSRDVSLATATVSITGAGFKPRKVNLRASIDGTPAASIGSYLGAGPQTVISWNWGGTAANVGSLNSALGLLTTSTGNYLYIALVSFDNDGITVTYTKVGSPTGTATLYFEFEE